MVRRACRVHSAHSLGLLLTFNCTLMQIKHQVKYGDLIESISYAYNESPLLKATNMLAALTL